MSNIKCVYCKSEDIKEDQASGMWYCPNCSRYLDLDEIIEEDVVTEEQHSLNTAGDDGEELTGLSLIVLNILMWIPLVNMFIVGTINKSDAKSQYRKSFSYKFITDMFLFLLVFISIAFQLYKYKSSVRNDIHEVVKQVSEFIDSAVVYDISVPSFKSLSLMEIIESQRTHDTDNSDEEVEFALEWKHLDGVVMSGSKVVDLLSDTGDEYIILFQSEDIRSRYSKSSYRNVGILMDGSEVQGSTGNYFYNGKLPDYVEQYTDDYGELVFISTDDLYSKRYIYYINPKYSYTVNILYAEDGSMLGFAFEEVER